MKRHVAAVSHHARHIVRHLRHKRILTRRSILAVFTLINAAFLLIIGVNTLSFPNTIVGKINVGLKTRQSIQELLTQSYQSTLRLTIHAQTYDLSYEHIGVYMNPHEVIDEIFNPNALPWTAKLATLFHQILRPRVVNVPLSFSQEFYEYISKINEAGLSSQDIVYLDQDNKRATLFAPQQRYMVDMELFQQELVRHFGTSENPLTVPLVEAPNALEQKVASANTKLSRVYSNPLTIIVGLNGSNQFMTLSPEDLRRYTTASLSADSESVTFSINYESFLPDLTTALSVYRASFNPTTAYERVGNGVKNALSTRFEGGPAESVKVGIDSGPNTEGEIASKYIEIDISQQKLFTFKNDKLVKTYRVSTGKDYPTPVGSFKILNKTGLGFSSIYNVWMPYWMGFEFSKELHAYFGIHELPYFYSGRNKIQRPREFIGAPNTGGCVALDIGDAKDVYQFADIGTPVVIYQ